MKFSNWNDQEVKSLFAEVEDCKRQNKALKNAFVNHAKKFHRQPNSVRNYYYHEVDNLLQDAKRSKTLGIDIQKHSKSHFSGFDKEAEEKLFEDVDNMTRQGLSVRSACMKLSGGNLTEMTRLQNKYQNMKRKLNANGKIILFRKRKVLTESDINSLLMGLVRLIKKNAIEDFVERSKLEKQSSNFLLKKAFVDLQRKDKQIAELRADFEQLKTENQKLVGQIELFSASKQARLKNHIVKKRFETQRENIKTKNV